MPSTARREAPHQRRGEGKGDERDDRRDHLEQHVSEREALGGRARADGGERRTRRRPDILSDDQRRALLEPDRACVERRERDRDRRGRGLHHRRHREADDDQLQKPERAREPSRRPAMPSTDGRSDGCRLLREAAHALLERGQPVEHERETGERRARRRDAPARQQLRQRADEDQRQRVGRERDAHADQRDEPAGAGRADIGAEDEAEPLREGQQARR